MEWQNDSRDTFSNELEICLPPQAEELELSLWQRIKSASNGAKHFGRNVRIDHSGFKA